MSDKADAKAAAKAATKARTALLKRLREERKDTVAQAQALLKEQRAIRKQLKKALADGPKTVPEIADIVDLPTGEVLWHVTAMKKYDLLVEGDMDGEYYQYALAEEAKS